MDLSKLQIFALCVLTTVVTNKVLYNNSSSKNNSLPNQSIDKPIVTSIPVQNPSPSASVIPVVNNSQNELILRELVNLRKDMFSAISNLPATTSSVAAVPTMSQSVLGGMVKISSSQWKRVNVYEKNSTSSKIINSLVYDTIYFYRQKQDSWYQIDLDSGQLGWVQADFLKEFP